MAPSGRVRGYITAGGLTALLILGARVPGALALVEPLVLLDVPAPGTLRELTPSRGVLFLVRSDDPAIWKTDGTPAGTVRVVSFEDSVGSLLDVDGVLYYSDDALWRTDGTPEGSRLVATDGAPQIAVDGGLVFRTQEGLARADAGGNVTPVTGLPSGINPWGFMPRGRAVLFFGYHSRRDVFALWRLEGTVASLVRNFPGVQESSNPVSLNGRDYLLTRTSDVSGPYRLLRVDADGVSRTFGSYRAGRAQGDCDSLVPLLSTAGERLVIGGHDRSGRQVLWGMDPRSGRRRRLAGVQPARVYEEPYGLCSEIGIREVGRQLGDSSGPLLFTISGQLWGSDGTPTGTRPLGAFETVGPRLDMGDGTVVGVTNADGAALLVTDGTPDGTYRLAFLPAPAVELAALGSRLFVVTGPEPQRLLVLDWPGR